MDREIEKFLMIDEPYTRPYINNYGNGSSLGSGDKYGRGNSFININPIHDFSGIGLKEYNGHKLYYINNYVLYITNIHFPYAMGEIIKNDLTTQKCFIAKVNNHIAVGESIHSVIDELREKIKVSTDNEFDVAKAFVLSHPDYDKEYDWDEMVLWHSLTNYSCEEGRRKFTKNANKLKGSKATPRELVEFMKKSRDYRLGEKIEKLYLKL